MRARPTPSLVVCRAVAIGLLLVATSASATPPTAAAVHAQRQLLRRHVELAGIAKTGAKDSPHLALLTRHAEFVAPAVTPMLIAGDAKHGLAIDETGQVFALRAGASQPAQPADLSAFQIDSEASLHRAIDAHVAGLAGVPTPRTTEDFRLAAQILQNRIDVANRTLALGTHFFTRRRATDHRLEKLEQHRAEWEIDAAQVPANQVELATDQTGGRLFRHRTSGWGYLAPDGSWRTARHVDLERVGITSDATFDDAVARRVLTLTGVAGSPGDARAMRRADRKLVASVLQARGLKSFVQDPLAHPDLAVLMKVREELGRSGPLVLREVGGMTLLVDQTKAGVRLLVRPTAAPSASGHLASLAELKQLGITTTRAFDAAVVEAMMEIAPEDLD